MSFSSLGLSQPLLDALNELGYHTPTPIQAEAIPLALKGKSLIAAAQTGSGKTATFVLPILEMLSKGETQRKKRARALILAPTRELAIQVNQSIETYGQHLGLKSVAIYGGVDYAPQKQQLIEGVDIVVATPGRLRDLYTQRSIHFDEIEMLVLDEADRMLDMGFIEDINKIVDTLPQNRQNLLFSATLSRQVRELAKDTSPDAIQLSVTKKTQGKPNIEQWLVTVDKDKKSALLSHLIKQNEWPQALIFIETKHGAGKLVSQLEKRGIEAECIHSGRTQAIREQILADFKSGKVRYLISTGISARGIDIDELPLVINYDLPYPADEYVHRIGRTGRAGAAGEAISLVSKDDFKNLCMIESRLEHLIERREIEEFAPKKVVPVSVLNFVPKNKPVRDSKESGPKGRNVKPRSDKGSSRVQSHKGKPQKSERTNSHTVSNEGSTEDTADNKLPLNPWGRH
ncbi:DEAD/DEAH box helicase [Shewanella eurypsychrophilus]|uniref:DEAD/DEAH box helicase n=1 Tax=Shewanella eurypsychrophilus TaxID=2593656 RepID=A0ABX6V6M2_9GAMM|nr:MULTISPECIES: DEAD/DEAH box helicase [Shewanella]QFU22975.1 DEAD/DEAH box helicase [Shewanella sp. YLB-09]QPG58261.1 DEAD/DEAH box helicase [Shewanella eurypsychrophilus]